MIQLKLLFLLLLAFFATVTEGIAQDKVAIKTNLLYGGLAQTPNLGVEIALGKRTTLDISGGYNWFNLSGKPGNNKKKVHWLVQPEFRYFLCERFSGHFFGVHALGGMYNIGNHEMPLLFGKGSKDYRYEGYAIGGGFSYGYQLPLARRWNLEFTVGMGYMRLKHDVWEQPRCGKPLEQGVVKHYFGPTKAGITVMFLF